MPTHFIPCPFSFLSMTGDYICLVPAWGAKTTFVPVVTFTPCRPTVGCVFHFALRFSQLVTAVPKRLGGLFHGARWDMKSTETTIDFSHVVT